MRDLVDDSGTNDLASTEDSKTTQSEPKTSNAAASTTPLIDDLLGRNFGGDDDLFVDVSFHIDGTVVDKSGAMKSHVGARRTESEPFNLYRSSSNVFQEHRSLRKEISNLMDGLSVNRDAPFITKNRSHVENDSDVLNSEFASQVVVGNANLVFPLSAMVYNFPFGFMYNPGFASQPMNYTTMGSLFAQQ
ncbi:hypothetical protein Salat_1447600 [Sesamum alatum]|uniref:Uncharacterized protein n=1 Tax=Sesamum alatum TaxID=300844 RepID=A0AAE1YAQ7_9LAMI|nr:hypothetical protein Salat_1447600 [Sesamum alatum]